MPSTCVFATALAGCAFLMLAPAAAAQADPAERRCSDLATAPGELGASAGVRMDRVNANEAVPACEEAVRLRPANPRNQFHYGRALEAARRYKEAATRYSVAEQAGFPMAAASLANLYKSGLGVPKDLNQAVSLYLKAGHGGYANAFSDLAEIYATAVPPNFEEAAKWNRKAADAGSADGYAGLGWHYHEGKGLRKNFPEAVRMYTEAARRGSDWGMYLLGLSYLRGDGVNVSYSDALTWIRASAERGNRDAQNTLGNLFRRGGGVARSEDEAFRWYLKAAQAGDSNAQFWVGTMYEGGRAVRKDEAAAVAWYRKAAEQNDPDAMTQLGFHLREGRGVKSDDREAMDWFSKAAGRNVDARFALGWGFLQGLGRRQDYWIAAQSFSQAADKGHAGAQLNLGILYWQGLGYKQDLVKARELFLQASRSPYPEIANTAKSLLAKPPPTPARQPTMSSKDTDALLGGIVLVLGLYAVKELLGVFDSRGAPSAPSGGRVASTGGGASAEANARYAEEQQQMLSAQIEAERAAEQAAAAARQAERDRYYQTQRCGFNANSNCF